MRHEERRGELLAAFDLAERGLEEHPHDMALKHRAVLVLARAGATEEAARRFGDYGLGENSSEEVAALHARVAKDSALACTGDERGRRARSAAELYGAIFARTGSYYPAINAATLWLIGGDPDRARRLAETVLGLLAVREDGSYWAAATAAEAHLLTGDQGAASRALTQAAARHERDYAALATTRRQLRLVCEAKAIDPQLLGQLAGPDVVHFCGHRIAGGEQARFAAEAEAAVAARIKDVVELTRPGFAYGSLAAGADILWTEALLAAGAEVHIVLPFARAQFLEASVAPSGPGWVERFDRCMENVASIQFATDDAYRADEVLFRYCSELAMGLALLRARYLDAQVRQLTVWDRAPAHGAAGTAIDVDTWRRGGRTVTVIPPTTDPSPDEVTVSVERTTSLDEPPAMADTQPEQARVVRAMLFADISGFSQLTDEATLVFAERVLGAFATVLQEHRGRLSGRRTWGDAMFLVFTDAPAAASCALDLQDAMAAIDLEAVGLPGHLALRLGGHLGPVFHHHDPITDVPDFTGSHVTRAARIEPITPGGAVYVTEPFAAALGLAGRSDLACDYVGHMPVAKDYGRLRMYRLRRTGIGASGLRAVLPPLGQGQLPRDARGP